MKIIGIVLIAAGILMLVLKGFSFTQEKTVVDIVSVRDQCKRKKDRGLAQRMQALLQLLLALR